MHHVLQHEKGIKLQVTPEWWNLTLLINIQNKSHS